MYVGFIKLVTSNDGKRFRLKLTFYGILFTTSLEALILKGNR
jgi:hypothetical protein